MNGINRAPSSIAEMTIDRRIEVIDGSSEQRASIRHVSDLRLCPFVVLLGEPGIGKSTVLDVEAASESVPVFKVRELMTGSIPTGETTLFLDALDEYRSDGQRSDKIYSLGRAIAAAKPLRWRLTCRSEDWRKGADVTPIQRTTGAVPVLVVQILPLDHDEACSVLKTLGESDPEAFLAKAETLGVSGLVENPLSLKLLHKAVAGGGAWPGARYDMFSSAVRELAHEHNDEYKFVERSSPDEIVTAASNICLLLLTTGSRAIWRSNGAPPVEADLRAYLTAHDLEVSHSILADVLDTALFRGEGEVFEPMHRTVAEFLAGQALAQAVVGTGGRAALPLSRAVTLVTGPDGGPPTELRGLFESPRLS